MLQLVPAFVVQLVRTRDSSTVFRWLILFRYAIVGDIGLGGSIDSVSELERKVDGGSQKNA